MEIDFSVLDCISLIGIGRLCISVDTHGEFESTTNHPFFVKTSVTAWEEFHCKFSLYLESLTGEWDISEALPSECSEAWQRVGDLCPFEIIDEGGEEPITEPV